MENRGLHNTIRAEGKVQLILWMDRNKEFCSKASVEEIRDKYHSETGTKVSVSTVQTHRNHIAPKFIKQRNNGISGQNNGVKLQFKIRRLQDVQDEILSVVKNLDSVIKDVTNRIDKLEDFKRYMES